MWEKVLAVIFQLLLIKVSEAGDIFKIGLSELDSLVNSDQYSSLESILSSSGSLAVTNLPSDYAQAVRNIKRSAPTCLEQLKYPQFYLPDGSQRRTFASASDEPEEYPDCIREDSETIAKHLDTVDALMSRLITAIAGQENLVWKTQENQSLRNFSTTLYKEHIHVYQPLEGQNDENVYAAPFHTDNGLLLMITPFQEHPLQVKNKMGEIVETGELGDDALLVLVASGLSQWLLKGTKSSSKFFPVPHAVPSLINNISPRTVFARMKVVPMDAFPTNMEAQKMKKRNLFEQFFNGVKNAASEVCPITKPAYQLALEKSWSTLKTTECSHSEAYCWMNCLELPTTCPQSPVQCINKDAKPCCTDTITEDCENMDQSCRWECKASNHTTDDKFCNGQGTDMYMQGFTASGNAKDACVILLFKSWVLDTRAKFGFGCVGVILLGIAIEGLLCLRRELQSRKILLRIRGVARRVSIVLLFALNIGSGYLAMLVAMTYSVELFICMVIGLVMGHAIFNTEAAVGESVDPCCASQAIGHTNDAKQHEAENT
eukprot:TRINITY_DN5638_c0_g1_i1.p1 TRINITY_DN5638_c0_g1~~TRINITY_DN5638_c0_g1_i1.p1  ORF type:complete len:545 (-),score=136.05 TRINITY_DN5638_c0_g1_i1:1228-2862(-)